MIVCSCHGITDHEFRRALALARQGSPKSCPAGQGCGCCMESLIAIVEQERRRESGAGETGEQPPRVLHD